MPIPSYPENRREEYLNNIATGSGEIPPYPENREEQYLDAIARNGGGGGGGSGGGVLVVHADADTGALDKTWQEIYDAGFAVLHLPSEGGYDIAWMGGALATTDPSAFGVAFIYGETTLEFIATSADGYPVINMGG